jgi:hypothetical protein
VLRVRVLGPLEVLTEAGTAVRLGAPKQRTLCALLALRAGQLVNAVMDGDRLVGFFLPAPLRRAVTTANGWFSSSTGSTRTLGVSTQPDAHSIAALLPAGARRRAAPYGALHASWPVTLRPKVSL